MIVLDASALTDWLLQTPGRSDIVATQVEAAGDLHTLDFAEAEILSALRRAVRRRRVDAERAHDVVDDLAGLPVVRHPVAPLRWRVWALRDVLSSYDAGYVALAEALAAPLMTSDQRLAAASGHRADVICVAP